MKKHGYAHDFCDVKYYFMIRPITRKEVFSRSRLADCYISGFQTPYLPPATEVDPLVEEYLLSEEYLRSIEYSWEEKGSLIKDLKDHLEPFYKGEKQTDDFAVLAYPRRNADYQTSRSNALIRFFEIMNIRQLYLVDELRYDWLRFPFSNKSKLAAVKSLVTEPSYREAFELDVEDLETVLPWFDHSQRHSIPIIFLISTDDKVPIAMFLCDDGNFHTSFHSKDGEKISYAAAASGMMMGGVEVCSIQYNP